VIRASFIAALGAVAATATGCSAQPSYQPVATVEQIMETSVEPTSNAVFDAAVWVNGVQVGGPKTDDDWKMVQANARMLAETGNLLLMGSRMKDQTGWVTRTQAMMDAANEAARAAEAKNTEAIFSAGGKIYQACLGCHLQYINPATIKPSRGGA
jgi:hypothetical protein